MSFFSSLIRRSRRVGEVRVLRLAAVLSVAVLASCSTGLYPLGPEAIRTRGLNKGEGYIVGTFRSVGMSRSGEKVAADTISSVTIQGTGSNKGKTVILRPFVLPLDRAPYFQTGEPSEILAVPVPVGDYEITRWSVTGRAVTATVTVTNRLPMKVPFRVKEGEAVYVGRANELSIIGKNILGMPVFGEGVVLLTDEFEEDRARISKFYPSIKRSSIGRSNVPAAFRSEMKRIADTPRSWWESF